MDIFFIILLIFIVVSVPVAIAVDWKRMRSLFGRRWFWWKDFGPHEEMDDHEMRYNAHDKDADVDLMAEASDHIKDPDDYLERLIDDEKLVQAMNYRLEMANMARVRKDHEMLTKYAIYGARISAKRTEIDDRKHQQVCDAGDLRREKEKIARQELEAMEPVSAEEWRMPAIGKPPKPPLWSEKIPELEMLVPDSESGLRDLTDNLAEKEAIEPKKPLRRFLEFGPINRFKPPLKISKKGQKDDEVQDVGID
jgi:hypothetical protein